jgi:NAD(P)H-hydrate epimerase
MPLPAPLSRVDPRLSKKDFGHVLVIAGSAPMLGAAALCSLAAMRSGAGLVTAAVGKDLNSTLQKKISNVVMTKPLAQSKAGTFSAKAFGQIKKIWDNFDAIAIGPGLGRDFGVGQLARKLIIHCPKPLVVDADALFALAGHTPILLKAKAARVLTPHPGEMSRLTKQSPGAFARQHHCVLLLKGHRTIVAGPKGQTYINQTGNVGMATAGSGDVLTGMIAALLGQGLKPFEAACWGAYLHGKAGDRAARRKSKAGMIASDIIDCIPDVLKNKK